MHSSGFMQNAVRPISREVITVQISKNRNDKKNHYNSSNKQKKVPPKQTTIHETASSPCEK